MQVRGLQSGEVYVMSVVAVDGDYMSESVPQEVETSSEGPIIQPKENVATAGWFIGIIIFFSLTIFLDQSFWRLAYIKDALMSS